MIELLNMGISEDNIQNMLELNPDIKELTSIDIKDKINILKNIDCTDNEIRNIFSTNSLFLTKSNRDIILLINKLNSLGFNTLNILFDSNPFILNLDSYEIDDYIKNRLNNNESLENIVDELESNTFLFNDI